MRRTMSLLTVLVLAAWASAVAANAGSYAVSTGVKGVVALYDLSSVRRTDTGFTIRNVAVSDHFPQIFGPVVYRDSREDYDCRTGHYVIVEQREYDRDGKLLNKIGRLPEDGADVVAGTASAEMYNRFCEAARRGVQVTGLAQREPVEEETPFAAYRYGLGLLEPSRH